MTRPMPLTVLLFALTIAPACERAAPADEAAAAETPPAHEHPVKTELDVKVPPNPSVLDRLPDMVERTLPSVVGISTKRVIRMMPRRGMMPFGFGFGPPGAPMERMQEGMGSGVVVSADGVILTNNHVIDGADEIVVKLDDGREFDAELLGADPKTDVAVVKLKAPPADLKPIEFGDSDSLRLGQPVIAIGAPFGLSSTVTMGIVSATGRANVGIVDYEDFIQTDAAINPGNSGGALVNADGQLVGINTAIVSKSGGYNGIGLAIPSNMARSIQERLVTHGSVARGWLGVAIQTITPELAGALDLDESTRGVLVSDVQKGSPAEKGGLKRGDVITQINDDVVRDSAELRNRVALEAPESEVAVALLRDGKPMSLRIELGTLGGSVGEDGALTLNDFDGVTFGPLTDEFRSEHRVGENVPGVAVREVEPGSVAARVGLRPGDVIVEVNRKVVKTPAELRDAYNEAERKLLLLVRRDGRTLFLAVPKLEKAPQ